MTFSLVCILEGGFIPTPIIYLRIFRVLTGGWRWCTKLPLIKLPSINLEGSVVSFSSYAQMETLLVISCLMVTTVRQSSSFLKPHTAKMLIRGRKLGMQLNILEVMLKEKIYFFLTKSCWRCQTFQNQKRS